MIWQEAADEEAYGELYEHISKEAVHDFTAERLRSYYDKNLFVAEKPCQSLAAARELILTPHYTAAFLHATIANEVMLKGVVLKPVIHGFIHNDSIAPLIVELAFARTGYDHIKKLLAKIFQDVSTIDLMFIRRPGTAKLLWQEITEIQKKRDEIMHRAEIVTKDDADKAIAVAAMVTEELSPALATSLGYHLHDGFRLCRDSVCLLPPEHKKLVERARMM